MSLQVEKLEKNMAKLTIEASAEDFEKAIQKVYLKARGRINIPGFRKGKAPRKLIEKMYGTGVFYEDAANDLIPTAYAEALKDCDLEIVSRPEINVTQIESGKPFIFTAEVAVKPEVTLGEYKGVEVEKSNVEVTDEDINKEVDKERENNSRTIDVDDRAVESGDIIKLDFDGSVDGVPFAGGKAENYTLTIGSGSFIPGFEDQLIGTKIGEDKDVTVTFPEDYHEKSLAGKEAVFKCKVNAITVKELPDADDEFASEVSEFETLAEYKEDIKKKLTEKKEKEARAKKEAQAVEKAVENATMEIPDAMIDSETDQMVNEFKQRLSAQGFTLEQFAAVTGQDEEIIRGEMRKDAEKKVNVRLVLEAIAEAEDLTVSDEDIDAELQGIADQYGMPLEQVKQLISNDAVSYDLRQRKALELIKETAGK